MENIDVNLKLNVANAQRVADSFRKKLRSDLNKSIRAGFRGRGVRVRITPDQKFFNERVRKILNRVYRIKIATDRQSIRDDLEKALRTAIRARVLFNRKSIRGQLNRIFRDFFRIRVLLVPSEPEQKTGRRAGRRFKRGFKQGAVDLFKFASSKILEAGKRAGAIFGRSFRTSFRLSSRGIGQISSFQKQISNPALIGGLAGVGAGIFSAKSFADLETLRTRLRGLTGDVQTAEAVFNESFNFSRFTQFLPKEVVDARIVLESIGVTGIKALSQVADAAAVGGRSIRDISLAIASLETEPLRRLGIFIRNELDKSGRITINFLNRFGRTVERTFQSFQSARVGVAQAFGERFEGANAAASRTINGLISTIRGNLQEAAADFGEGFSESLRRGLFALRDGLLRISQSRVLNAIGERLGATIEAAVKRAFGGAVSAPQALVTVAASLAGSVAGLKAFVSEFKNQIDRSIEVFKSKEFASSLSDAFSQGAIAILSSLAKALLTFNLSIGPVIVRSLISGFRRSGEFLFNNVFSPLIEAFKSFSLKNFATGNVAANINIASIANAFEKSTALQKIADALLDIKVTSDFGELTDSIQRTISRGFGRAFQGVGKVLSTLGFERSPRDAARDAFISTRDTVSSEIRNRAEQIVIQKSIDNKIGSQLSELRSLRLAEIERGKENENIFKGIQSAFGEFFDDSRKSLDRIGDSINNQTRTEESNSEKVRREVKSSFSNRIGSAFGQSSRGFRNARISSQSRGDEKPTPVELAKTSLQAIQARSTILDDFISRLKAQITSAQIVAADPNASQARRDAASATADSLTKRLFEAESVRVNQRRIIRERQSQIDRAESPQSRAQQSFIASLNNAISGRIDARNEVEKARLQRIESLEAAINRLRESLDALRSGNTNVLANAAISSSVFGGTATGASGNIGASIGAGIARSLGNSIVRTRENAFIRGDMRRPVLNPSISGRGGTFETFESREGKTIVVSDQDVVNEIRSLKQSVDKITANIFGVQ